MSCQHLCHVWQGIIQTCRVISAASFHVPSIAKQAYLFSLYCCSIQYAAPWIRCCTNGAYQSEHTHVHASPRQPALPVSQSLSWLISERRSMKSNDRAVWEGRRGAKERKIGGGGHGQDHTFKREFRQFSQSRERERERCSSGQDSPAGTVTRLAGPAWPCGPVGRRSEERSAGQWDPTESGPQQCAAAAHEDRTQKLTRDRRVCRTAVEVVCVCSQVTWSAAGHHHHHQHAEGASCCAVVALCSCAGKPTRRYAKGWGKAGKCGKNVFVFAQRVQ